MRRGPAPCPSAAGGFGTKGRGHGEGVGVKGRGVKGVAKRERDGGSRGTAASAVEGRRERREQCGNEGRRAGENSPTRLCGGFLCLRFTVDFFPPPVCSGFGPGPPRALKPSRRGRGRGRRRVPSVLAHPRPHVSSGAACRR